MIRLLSFLFFLLGTVGLVSAVGVATRGENPLGLAFVGGLFLFAYIELKQGEIYKDFRLAAKTKKAGDKQQS